MEKTFIIANEDLETYGIIGIVQNPKGYENNVFQMKITNLDGNKQTDYSIGDTFDIIGGDFKRYYPPDTPESFILRERLEILENKLKSHIDTDEERANHFEYIEQVEIPRLLKEIEKEEEKERLEKESRNKILRKEEKEMVFNKENLKKMIAELFETNELSVVSTFAEDETGKTIKTSILIDEKEIFQKGFYLK